MRILERETTDSTMLDARRAIERAALRELTVFVAKTQTGGVGRFGRSWSSPSGGLWMTLAMPVDGGALPGVLEGMGLRVGVAATETIASALQTVRAELGGSDAGPSAPSPKVMLKWPNDVLLNGRKVAGILIEVVRAHEAPHVLIGVGVNANFSSRELPDELRGRATTVMAELGAPVSLAKLRDALVKALFAAAARNGLTSDTLARARALLAGVNEPVRITLANAREPIEGTLLGLSDRGNPLVMTGRGEVEAPSGSEMGNVVR